MKPTYAASDGALKLHSVLWYTLFCDMFCVPYVILVSADSFVCMYAGPGAVNI